MAKQNIDWQDSGYDCEHCGGEILAGSEKTVLKQAKVFQCNKCGCRWSSGGKLLEIGNGPFCAAHSSAESKPIDKRYWWIGGVALVSLLFFRFGGALIFTVGASLIRLLIPLGILVLIGMLVFHLGRQMGFWE